MALRVSVAGMENWTFPGVVVRRLLASATSGRASKRPRSSSEKTEEVVSSDQNYHTDSNYKYEHRTGTTGNYDYNYDVSGYDSDANEVSGNISIQNNNGTGTIIDKDGNEIDVDVEWIDNGKLKGTDVDGNEFELEVN